MRKKKTIRKTTATKKKDRRKNPVQRKKARKKKTIRGKAANVEIAAVELRGLGPRAGGQSGDIQGLPGLEESGPESVEELAEEGQDYEAEVIAGVENVPDADQGGVRSRRIREDDLPPKSSEQE
jgi:hypothetical protein